MKPMIGFSRERTGERGVFPLIHRYRKSIGLAYRGLALVGFLATLTGLGQAAILLIVVRVATALTADTELISGSVGPISATDLTTAQLILLGFAILIGLLLIEFATSWAQASLFVNAQRTARSRLLAAYSGANLDAQLELKRGDTSQLLLNHPTQAAGVVNSLGSGISSVANFVTLTASALLLSPVAGLVVLGGLTMMLLALRPLILMSRRLGGKRATEQRRLGALALERLEITREIKSFAVEKQVDGPLRLQIDKVLGIVWRMRIVNRMTSASYRTGGYAITLGMMAVIDASNTSSLAALTGSLLMLLRSLSYGQAAQSTYQSLSEVAPVVEQLVEEEQRLLRATDSVGGASVVGHIGALECRGVCFGYPGGEPVLADISLRINEGDLTALVGPSGAGKSTLMYLLARLRVPTGGDLLADDIDVAKLDLVQWRQRVAYVPQDPKLQSGTVEDAIRFHRAHISAEAVRLAARRAHIEEEILAWPNGYETEVGQLGEAVSGGQRQRLVLARAIAGNPDVLLLDEPTSAVDPESERLIGQTLDELRGEMTIVVIAHRFSTVERANNVVLLVNGRVVPHETDDHTTLRTFMEKGSEPPREAGR